MLKFLSTHKVSVLSALLMVAAAVLGADGSFAMAVEIAGTEAAGEVTQMYRPNRLSVRQLRRTHRDSRPSFRASLLLRPT